MAAAVENAAVVLLCWSERYQDSINCRAEAEFAFKLEKPIVPVRVENYKPTGWLNMLLGSKYYVSCKTVAEVPERVIDITKQLGDRGRTAAHDMPGQVPQTSKENKSGGKPLDDWSVDEVQKWLAQNGLGHIGGKLAKFDGALLAQFRGMHRTKPRLFYENGRAFLGITDLTDLMRLAQRMETI